MDTFFEDLQYAYYVYAFPIEFWMHVFQIAAALFVSFTLTFRRL